MIDQTLLTKPKPVLKPSDLGGSNIAVVTISSAEQVPIKGDPKVLLTFREFPEHNYYLNLTSIRRAVDGMGPNEREWPGKRVVLEVVRTNDPQKNRQVPALWIAEAETWPEHIRAFEKRASAGSGSSSGGSGRKSGAKATPRK